ncbi:MAG: deoxyribonuclease IV [Actinobacteria bacterium]|nr:deoxyribonuclease IV [Actinomycetota bacterium]
MPRPSRRPVGCHVFVAGGLRRALHRACDRGAEVLQIFPSNPRGWAVPVPDVAEEAWFRASIEARSMPLFLHAPYLVNIASRDDSVLDRSRASLEFALARGARLGARGVVVHAGSATGDDRASALARATSTILSLLDRVEGCDLVVELTAGSGDLLASTVEQVAEVIDACDRHPRVRACVDTCHLYAAGVDISRPTARRRLRDELRALDPSRVAVVHVNDSRDPPGSRRDRHARVGQGTIGLEPLRAVLRIPELRHAPLVLETPGTAIEQRDDLVLVRELAA